MLKGGQKEAHQQDNGKAAPPADSPQFNLEVLRAATPVTNTEDWVASPDMLQRPRTSGGPEDRGKQFHKKVAPVTLGPGDRKFDFPFPSPNISSTTVLYATQVHDSTEGIIGIALGSPTMNPNWKPSLPSNGFPSDIPGTVTNITSNTAQRPAMDPRQEGGKPKLSRWKSIFGKKGPPPQEQKQSFYQLAQSVIPARADSHHDDDSLVSRTVSVVDSTKDEYHPLSPPTFKPEIRESRNGPKGQELPVPNRPRALTNGSTKMKVSRLRTASSPQQAPKGTTTDSPTVPKVVVSGSSLTTSPSTTGPLLDVAIPDIKMERYSVMFGNLLQPNASTSSSLLARRQGVEKLKPLTALSAKVGVAETTQNGMCS